MVSTRRFFIRIRQEYIDFCSYLCTVLKACRDEEDYLYLVNAMFLGCAGTRVIASEEPEYLQLLGRYVGLCTAAGGKIVYAFQQRNDQSFGPTSC